MGLGLDTRLGPVEASQEYLAGTGLHKTTQNNSTRHRPTYSAAIRDGRPGTSIQRSISLPGTYGEASQSTTAEQQAGDCVGTGTEVD
jgi:hypothetical protein